MWRVSADIYWCLSCNLPLIAPRCYMCGSHAVKVHASPPKDLRPAFKYDLKLLEEVLREEFGFNAWRAILGYGVVLLNKVPYVDQANEVIVDGWVMGTLYYNPEVGRWRFRPSYEGAARLLISGATPYIEVEGSEVRLWDTLSISGARGCVPHEGGKYVVVANQRGMAIGVAVTLNDGRVKVIKRWEPHKPHLLEKRTTWDKVVKANEPHIEAEERRATAIISNVVKSPEAFISFSGGKDSLATLILSLKALGDKPMLFNDTGIEAPATVEHVWSVASKFGLELILAGAGESFWNSLPVYGPPARDYRWCCKVCKLIPIAKTVRERFRGDVYAILGQRKYESFARLRAPAVDKSRWIPNLVSLSPIRNWSALHVWLYLMKERVEGNPLYNEGFDRIGCWLCPACELAELKRVEEVYPHLWSKWRGKVLAWCEEKAIPQEWFELGLWRWRRFPGDIKKFALRAKADLAAIEKCFDSNKEVEVTLFVKPCENIYEAQGVVKGSLDVKRLANLLRCTGGKISLNERLGLLAVRIDEGFMSISTNNNISVRSESGEDLRRALKLLVKSVLRAKHCSLCGSCINWCPSKAVTVSDHVKISDVCAGCRTCINVCPVATYMYKSSVLIEGEEHIEG
ncbi:MAG: phosphoadenosine phosphosulfate reductase family protein [Candidatus Nezhaarchaeota archaeon]|nr:phosphoadenosine phosphosulfate reductase family protein [Candidatus Nezhaarchaeota archaeon]